MSARTKCRLCGKDPAAGWAKIGDDRYCHGDDDPDPTCYMRASWGNAGAADLSPAAKMFDPALVQKSIDQLDAGEGTFYPDEESFLTSLDDVSTKDNEAKP